MVAGKKITKEQLLKAIENLEKNPNDKIGILGDIGIGVVGAAAAGGAVAAFGGTTLLFGLVAVAPPVGLVVGGAALGAAGLVGAKRMLFDGTFTQGKKQEMLKQLKEQLKEAEAKERADKVKSIDKTQFTILLKQPIKYNLITPEKAQKLITAVENGQMPLDEAYRLVENIIKEVEIKS